MSSLRIARAFALAPSAGRARLLRIARAFALVLILGALGRASPSRADDVTDLAGLLDEPVVSTASKTAETAGLAPATTSIVTAEDLRRHGIGSLDEALNFLALGLVAEPSYATPEVGARGVLLSGDFGNHVLLLVDGHALNEPWDGTAYYDRSAGIPLDLVDHIEVILGPGSVLYGSSAMLGVINVITKRARDYQGLHLVADGAYPAAAHAAAGLGVPFAWGGSEGGLTVGLDDYHGGPVRLRYGAQDYDGTTWGGATAHHRAVGVPSGQARLALGNLEVSVRAAQSRRAATQIWYDFDDPRNWERDRWLSGDVRWSNTVGRFGFTARGYGDLYDYLQHSPSTAAADCLDAQTACVFRNGGKSGWYGGEVTTTYDWLGDGRFSTLAGIDVRRQHVSSFAAYDDVSGPTTTVSQYAVDATVAGAYLQQTLRPVSWLSVNAGLRLDYAEHTGSHLSPRVAVVTPAWAGGTLKAIYSEAFRAPSFYEQNYADSTSQLAAQNLAPETVRSVEGVVEQRAGTQRLRLSVFRTWWQDLVVTTPATDAQVAGGIARGVLEPGAQNVKIYANAARVDGYGLNADWSGSALAQRLRYGTGITLAHTRTPGGARLAAAAQAFGNARVSWDPGAGRPVLGLAAQVVGPRPVAGTGFEPTPEAPTRVELRGAVTGPVGAGLSYQLTGTWRSTGTSAYAVGPLRDPAPGYDTQALLPLSRYEVRAGLRYDR
jgi:outer membrane cobalamin receptor